MKSFNTEKKVIFKNQSGETEEDKILKSLFVTNADDALNEFEQEKETEIE